MEQRQTEKQRQQQQQSHSPRNQPHRNEEFFGRSSLPSGSCSLGESLGCNRGSVETPTDVTAGNVADEWTTPVRKMSLSSSGGPEKRGALMYVSQSECAFAVTAFVTSFESLIIFVKENLVLSAKYFVSDSVAKKAR